MLNIVTSCLCIHPWRHRVTLVPEREGEVTTEGGLDVLSNRESLTTAVAHLHQQNIYVSLFIDPDIEQVKASNIPYVDMIEINTARYCEGYPNEIQRIKVAAQMAKSLDIEVAAGHGLTHHNLPQLVAAVPEIIEYNIGHSIIARSVFVGLEQAVRDILQQIHS